MFTNETSSNFGAGISSDNVNLIIKSNDIMQSLSQNCFQYSYGYDKIPMCFWKSLKHTLCKLLHLFSTNFLYTIISLKSGV